MWRPPGPMMPIHVFPHLKGRISSRSDPASWSFGLTSPMGNRFPGRRGGGCAWSASFGLGLRNGRCREPDIPLCPPPHPVPDKRRKGMGGRALCGRGIGGGLRASLRVDEAFAQPCSGGPDTGRHSHAPRGISHDVPGARHMESHRSTTPRRARHAVVGCGTSRVFATFRATVGATACGRSVYCGALPGPPAELAPGHGTKVAPRDAQLDALSWRRSPCTSAVAGSTCATRTCPACRCLGPDRWTSQ